MSSIKDYIFKGEENAVSLSELCRITGLENRTLRLVIETERRNGTVICSSVNGYFYPETEQELQAYVHQERARASSIKAGLRAAERLLKEWKGEQTK